MIRRFAVAAVAAVCLSAAAPAAGAVPAAPPQAGSGQSAAHSAALERWSLDVAAWAKDYTMIVEGAAADMGVLSLGLQRALEYAEREDATAGRRWFDSFLKERTEAYDALLARLDALDGAPPPLPPPFSRDPQSREMMEKLKGHKAVVRGLLTRGQASRRSFLAGLERAIEGDDAAHQAAREALADLFVEGMESARLLAELQADVSTSDQPPRYSGRAMAEIIGAFSVIAKTTKAEVFGRPFDPEAAATDIERHLRQAELHVTTGEGLLANMRRTADQAGTPSLKRKLHALADSLEGTFRDQRALVRLTRERASVLRRTGSARAALDHESEAFDAHLKAIAAGERRRQAILAGD